MACVVLWSTRFLSLLCNIGSYEVEFRWHPLPINMVLSIVDGHPYIRSPIRYPSQCSSYLIPPQLSLVCKCTTLYLSIGPMRKSITISSTKHYLKCTGILTPFQEQSGVQRQYTKASRKISCTSSSRRMCAR